MKHLSGLDVLRGLLAWTVVAVHYAVVSGWYNRGWQLAGIWAVAGFLVMSGFVIGRMILAKEERYSAYLFRRFMRLFPVFAVMLGFAIMLKPWIMPVSVEGVTALEHERFWPALLTHLAMLHGLWPHPALGQYAFLPPAWSVSLEWQCLILAPMILAFMVRYREKVILFLLAITLTIALLHIGMHIKLNDGFFPMRIGFFILGLTIAIYSVPFRVSDFTLPWPRLLIWLGKVSYSTYLCHWLVIALFAPRIPPSWTPMARMGFLVIAVSPLIVIVSFGLYEWVEKPGIALGKSILRRKTSARELGVKALESQA